MSKTLSSVGGAEADKLLRVAKYFRKPQRFIPVGDIRAEMRQTLEMVSQGSVVITTHGEPQAAIVNFETFEAVRGAVTHLLLGGDGGQHQSNARGCPSAVRERRADWRG